MRDEARETSGGPSRKVGGVLAFEDLIAWKKARALTSEVYGVTGTQPFAKDFGLSGQIQRAAVSIMSNIAEGNERSTTADYVRFLYMAKASCCEVRSQLYVALDLDYINKIQFEQLRQASLEVGRLIGGLIVSLSRRGDQTRPSTLNSRPSK